MWFVGGSIYPFLSDATKTIAPINIVFLRTFGTTILLGSILLIFQPSVLKNFRIDRRLIPVVVCAVMFYPICSGALAWSSTKIPSAISALLFSTLPALMIVYSAIRGKRPTLVAATGVVLAMVAVIFLVGTPSGPVTTSGVVAGLISVLAWFVATEIWIAFTPNYPLLLATTLQSFVGALGCFLLRPLFHAPPIRLSQTLHPSVIFLILALAAQHWSYLGISTRVSVPVLSSFAFINPLVAGIVGYVVFHQMITAVQAIAGSILLAGVFLVVGEDVRSNR